MDYIIFPKLLDSVVINYIKNETQKVKFNEGRVGNRVNLKQKIRKDLWLTKSENLKILDDYIYDKTYDTVKELFDINIDYREHWKIGWYNSDEKGFYNLHTDDARETAYRKISMVFCLSDSSDYHGGELHFPKLNKQFKLTKGDVIIFRSSLLHGVKPVISGERYVMIGFFFDNEGMQKKKNIQNLKNNQLSHSFFNRYKPLLTNRVIDYSYEKNHILTNSTNLKSKLSNIDKDYSDLHNHPWKNYDDYYFENNNSKTLFVSFAGMGQGNSIPTFNFYNFMKQYNNIDKLFLRCTGPHNGKVWCCRYYLLGFRHNTKTIEESVIFLRELITRKKYNKIVFTGCSAGGYASILFSELLNIKVDKVIVFNPQTVIDYSKRLLIGDKYNCPANAEYLTNKKFQSDMYKKTLDLMNFHPFKNNIEIHYNLANKSIDKNHAKRIESKNCIVKEYCSTSHFLALELRDSGILKQILDDEFNCSK